MEKNTDPNRSPLWHAGLMLARLRLLLHEPDLVIEDIMSDVNSLLALNHRIASPIAIRLGLEVLARNGIDYSRAKQLADCIDRFRPFNFRSGPSNLHEAIQHIELYQHLFVQGRVADWARIVPVINF